MAHFYGGRTHRQIWRQLRRAILDRRLAPGTRLLSSRLMAAEFACARGTVLAALDQLIAEGYLQTRTGSGISVAADLPDEMLAPPLAGGPRDRRRRSCHGAPSTC